MSDDKTIAVRVALRVRPLVERELLEGCQNSLNINTQEAHVVVGRDKVFTFDYAFPPECNQSKLYGKAVADRIDYLFKGYNLTVLAYGQTGSGKTHTMGTSYVPSSDVDNSECGVIQRAVDDIFRGIEERSSEVEFAVKVSFLEVYKEDIYDLLQKNKDSGLVIREDQDGIKIVGLTEQTVSSAAETLQALEQGSLSRTTASTAMNARSSRSHAIFTISVEQRPIGNSEDFKRAKFHLVDLAGSERANKTGALGERFKEGVNINRGLLALGNVISSLCDESSHVPYRDSKLTRLLQDSLGGNSHTIMIACVSPADSNLDETINTLRYAYRARKIKNKPIVNRDPNTAELYRLKQEIEKLQFQILQQQTDLSPRTRMKNDDDMKILLERNKSLEVENVRLTKELQHALDQTTGLCEKALKAEVDKDLLSRQLEELQEKTKATVKALVKASENNPELKAQLELFMDVQDQIVKIQFEQKEKEFSFFSPTKKMANGEDQNISGECDDEVINDENVHKSTMKQAAMSRELEQLDRALALKVELASKMQESDTQMSAMRIQFENNVKQMEDEISSLQKEKEELSSALKAVQASTNASKVSEQRRRRLQELEAKITSMRKEIQEKTRIVKIKQDAERKVEQLQREITSMKSARVKLLKQMREEGERFRTLKVQKEREVAQLKQKDRKRQYELTKLQDDFRKQKTVLKRKMEEATAANRRLNEALKQQKSVAERRLKEKQHLILGVGTRIDQWLGQEIEVLSSREEAQHHLQVLMDDRKTIMEQLNFLKGSIDSSEPPRKKRSSICSDSDEENAEALQQIEVLQKEFDVRNLQIAELQQQLADADDDEKSKHRWNNIQNMVEAKCAMKFLFNVVVDTKREVFTSKYTNNAALENLVAEIDKLKQDLKASNDANEQLARALQQLKVATMKSTQEQEDRFLCLLKQLNATTNSNPSFQGDPEMAECIEFQKKEIERLSKVMQEELKAKDIQIENLKMQMANRHYSEPAAKRKKKLLSSNNNGAADITFIKSDDPSAMGCFLSDDDGEDEELFEDNSSDPDWRATPEAKRARAERIAKRQEKLSEIMMPNNSSSVAGCKCNFTCSTKRCSCNKKGTACGEFCSCSDERCCNRSSKENISDVLNSTYDVSNFNDSEKVLKEIKDTSNRDSTDDFVAPTPQRTMYLGDYSRRVHGKRKLLHSEKTYDRLSPPKL